MPREVFVAGQVLTAAELNTVSDQTVMTFAGTAARGSAIPTPVEGMISYLEDGNRWEGYTTSWGPLGGKILQVISTAKTDTFSTSSVGFTDITGLSASITPSSATSKILVSIIFGQIDANGTERISLGFTRNGTAVGRADAAGNRIASTSSLLIPNTDQDKTSSLQFLDSPASTSALTYQAQMAVISTGTGFLNRTQGDGDTATNSRSISTITLMEVSA